MRRLPWLILILLSVLIGGGCKMLYRSLRYNVPSVYDHRLWPARTIHHPDSVWAFQENISPLPEPENWAFGKWLRKGMTTTRFMKETGTAAFLVIRGDTILHEEYFGGNDATTIFNAFSTSKVFLSALVGIAIEEGKIGGVDQSVGDYLPWCGDSVLCAVKIRHLLQMTSGIHSTEGYLNPWSTSTKLYYGDQVARLVRHVSLAKPPGERFFYQNINSQLLGMILAEATGMPLAQYLEEKIWKPLGMESDATWSLHENSGTEKAFCCLNARARDFARFGLLYLNEGNWHGEQIVPKEWALLPLKMDTTEGASFHYQYAWYTNLAREDYYAQGLLGQFIYIHPASRTVIVRLGNSLDYNVPWYDIFRFVAGIRSKPEPVSLTKSAYKDLEGVWKFGVGNNNDSSMVGKQVQVKATNKGLKVKSNFQKTWTAFPSDSTHFFNLEFSRYLDVTRDSIGPVIHWERRGLRWTLRPD